MTTLTPRKRGARKATPQYLERAALHYLERYASSAENLRRVLMRKVERSAREHGTDPEDGARDIDALLRRLQERGLLDDAAYAAGRTRSLARRGDSPRAIRVKLSRKGVPEETIESALAGLREEVPEPELTAAARLARRRRLGPYRPAPNRADYRERDLAALARAGFTFDVARQVVEAESVHELEGMATALP